MAPILPPAGVPDLLKQAAESIANVEKHREAMRQVAAQIAATPVLQPPAESQP